MSTGAASISAAPFDSIPLLPTNPNPRSRPLHHHRPFLSSSRSPANPQRLRREFPPPPRMSCSLDLPFLPFESSEVLIPSETKTLHLYEARFLALLEESLLKRKMLFVHFVLEPVLTSSTSSRASFAARYGCLALIEKVERLKVGALVSIRGIGRVSIVEVVQMEPYLRGTVIPMQDHFPDHEDEMDLKLVELRESLYTLHSLQIKLKAMKDELLQTRIKNSLTWAERESFEECVRAFIPKLAERISFAALQPVSGTSHSEFLALQREKLRAMDSRDTYKRLNNGVKLIKQNIAMVAAKLAIQSLEI